MTYYSCHVFMCVNQRDGDRACCANRNAMAMFKEMRRILKERGMHGPGLLRVNKSGCMDRCDSGPVMVIYPDAVWYRYESAADLVEIVDSHLDKGQIVERLRLHNDQ